LTAQLASETFTAVQITAAVARGPGVPLSIEMLELEDPRDDEVIVRAVSAAAG
jgi:Zn-dependent alcohol dehydrogenase